jgi:hypothetical protein
MKRIIIISLLLTIVAVSGFAQKMKTVEAEYTYYAPENVSLAEARRYALNQARLKAIAEEFGTIVAQTNLTHIETGGEKSSSRFSSFGSSDVKGEWIEDSDKPEYTEGYEGGTLIVTCKVKGKAREIVSSKIEFLAKVLCNGTEDRFESDQFKSGDELYLSFLSPVNGYLAVYLVDDDNQVQCLLPYTSQTNGIYQVEADRKYILFSEKAAPRDQVDEYVLTANHDLEHNQVYVIFSPNQFVKAVDEASSRVADAKGIGGFPREVSFDDFHKWLAKCRRHDKDMCLKKILISVKK